MYRWGVEKSGMGVKIRRVVLISIFIAMNLDEIKGARGEV